MTYARLHEQLQLLLDSCLLVGMPCMVESFPHTICKAASTVNLTLR